MSKNQIYDNIFMERMNNSKKLKYQQEYNELKDLVENKYKPNNGMSLWHDHKTIYTQIEKLLMSHGDKKFYLTFDINYVIKIISDPIYESNNWKIYDEEEIKNIIPENVNKNKICYSNGNRPFADVQYPSRYTCTCIGFPYDTSYCHIEHLAYSCNNLYFVHPALLECVKP